MNLAVHDLQRWTAAVFEACGVAVADASLAARMLCRTSLRGIDTHGISRVPAYVEQLHSRAFKPDARVTLSERHGTLHCEGGGGLGQVVASAALERAIDRARTQAIVSCTIENTGHLGALGILILEAAERGFVAVLCQTTPPILGMPGLHGPVIGNNPIAFAMPVPGGDPLVFDMALSVVARGKVAAMARDGVLQMPEGWALDGEGELTTDPQVALRGAMMPVAGHKGLGLAMLVQCLAGSLAGAEQPQGSGQSAGGIGAFLLIANPDLLTGRAAFEANVAQWLGTYRQAGGRYPGQRQAATERERLLHGVPVGEALHRELTGTGARAGVPFMA
jgi:LDH2 family malate/lactate/ureidoglycolate dehydrogenase